MATTASPVFNSSQNVSTSSPTSTEDPWVTTTVPRTTILAALLLFGFLGNLSLVVTICHNKRLRSTAFYILTVNIAVTNIMECVFNMTFLLSTNIVNTWHHEDIVCHMNSFFIHLVGIETLLSVTSLTTDRMLAVKYLGRYDKFIASPRYYIILIYTWVQTLGFCIPLAIGVVPSNVYNYIYFCIISKGSSIVYSGFTSLFCFIFPIILLIIFNIIIIRIGLKERYVVRVLLTKNNYTNDASHEEPRIWKEIHFSKLSGLLFIAWILLHGPMTITSFIKQFQYSSELKSLTPEQVAYTWHIDLVLLWLRFLYTIVLPVSAYLWNKELWQSVKDVFLCHKNNAIEDGSLKTLTYDGKVDEYEKKIKEEKKKKDQENLKEVLTSKNNKFEVPVLFATSHGVLLQTRRSDFSSSDIFHDGHNDLYGKKCDVFGSRDFQNQDDTSDYDSGNEQDPFSVSQPISAKNLRNTQLSSDQRSASNPDVRELGSEKHCSTNVSGTSAADSGLDLTQGLPGDGSLKHTPNNSLQYTKTVDCKNSLNNEIQDRKKEMNHEAGKQERQYNEPNKKRDVSSGAYSVENSTLNEKEITTNEKLRETDNNFYSLKSTDNMEEMKSTDNITKNISSSPLPSKKKRKKNKSDTSRSSTPNSSIPSVSSPVLPPRPPPRLAPIIASSNGTAPCQQVKINRDFSGIGASFECLSLTSDFTHGNQKIPMSGSTKSGAKESVSLGIHNAPLIEKNQFMDIRRYTPSSPPMDHQTGYHGNFASRKLSMQLDCSQHTVDSGGSPLSPSGCMILDSTLGQMNEVQPFNGVPTLQQPFE
ncbi:hypothetical protein CHS0354_006345 [Potamilus streckersoni]|uniref:G-protein coupled receptors family 1 profile domain-containing protein n=1 Tax=Potamilus streckersoni TaxID=2493646 RepID=A0AAE0SW80_9BIVA|nr:hypothetical protein CHS0354_006345 [Potamilus streckersoni]